VKCTGLWRYFRDVSCPNQNAVGQLTSKLGMRNSSTADNISFFHLGKYSVCKPSSQNHETHFKTARWPPLSNPTIKSKWYEKMWMTSYTIVQHSLSYVRAVVVGAACSSSGAALPTGPVDASEGGIRVAENYVTRGNWSQYLSSDTMVEDPPFANPCIKTRWYGRGESFYYAIVQHSLSYMRVMAIGAARSRSGATVPMGLANASEGGVHIA
jgi:hypothetical protein